MNGFARQSTGPHLEPTKLACPALGYEEALRRMARVAPPTFWTLHALTPCFPMLRLAKLFMTSTGARLAATAVVLRGDTPWYDRASVAHGTGALPVTF